MKRILLADDHTLMLDGLIGLLREHYEIVGTATNGRELLQEAERLKPDIIVLDISMPELNGIEASKQLARSSPEIKIVFVTQQLRPEYVRAALDSGAMAYVAKQSAGSELLEALQQVKAGRYYVTPLVRAKEPKLADPVGISTNPAHLFGSRLTQRQREVLQLIAEGKTGKEVAAALRISAKTVEFHRNALMNELALRTTAELTRYALAHGLISD